MTLLQGHAAIEVLDFHDLPFMSPDLEDPRPDAVNRVLQKVQEADGLWIFASEYNLGPSAYLKTYSTGVPVPSPIILKTAPM